jgi:peptidoglycan hydrolase-like protein with peptidoglycan-binding domain
MTNPTVRVGSKGPAVSQAQQALGDRGYYFGTDVDGIFGPHTFAGVVAYQEARSAGQYYALSAPLAVDGVVGPETWARLTPDTVRRGDNGAGVRLLQSILKYYAYPPYDPGAVDGDFGPRTETAVINFQKDLELTTDGIVGPLTWIRLWS